VGSKGDPIVLLTVKGGPECDWERGEPQAVADSFSAQGTNVSIGHCEDFDALSDYLLARFEPQPQNCAGNIVRGNSQACYRGNP